MKTYDERQAIREARRAADELDGLGPDLPDWVWGLIIIASHLAVGFIGVLIGMAMP